MTKNQAPIIEKKLPPFQIQNGVGKVIIPYTLKRNASNSTIENVQLIITSASNGKRKHLTNVKLDKDLQIITCDIEEAGNNMGPKVGLYYKVQAAFIDTNDTIGYYSDVAITKATGKAIVNIQANDNDFLGTYTNIDTQEKVYSYQFDLLYNDKVIESSGELLHNSQNDQSPNSSQDEWSAKTIIPSSNGMYKIRYTITTVNGLTTKVEQSITTSEIEDTNFSQHFDLLTQYNEEEAYVTIGMNKKKTEKPWPASLTTFRVIRTAAIDNHATRNIIKTFSAENTQKLQNMIIKDYTVEQGATYRYYIQYYIQEQELKGWCSPIASINGEIKIDFEHLYLSDDAYQLKIKYNPKISNIKPIIQETKVETIGGAYPFFFRNGNTKYKEFNISGLLSAQADENGEFANINRTMSLQKRPKTPRIFEDNFGIQKRIRNLIPYPYAFITNPDSNLIINGITIIVNKDGSLNLNGIAEKDFTLRLADIDSPLQIPKGYSVKFSGFPKFYLESIKTYKDENQKIVPCDMYTYSETSDIDLIGAKGKNVEGILPEEDKKSEVKLFNYKNYICDLVFEKDKNYTGVYKPQLELYGDTAYEPIVINDFSYNEENKPYLPDLGFEKYNLLSNKEILSNKEFSESLSLSTGVYTYKVIGLNGNGIYGLVKQGETEIKDYSGEGITFEVDAGDRNFIFSVAKTAGFTDTSMQYFYPILFKHQEIQYEENNINSQLTADNFTKERNYKLDILDWLSNGKPKIMRSAPEGNYIVRLMNVSLSPIDTLGRMIHSFNATAYEYDTFTHDNLIKYNLIK